MAREAINKYCQELGVEVIGAGISGNKVPDLEKRLERDVLSKKPTIVVIYIGIRAYWGGRRLNGPQRHPGVPDHVRCPACGERNAGNTTFCEKCGQRLHDAPA